jgi:hypothetical protein
MRETIAEVKERRVRRRANFMAVRLFGHTRLGGAMPARRERDHCRV